MRWTFRTFLTKTFYDALAVTTKPVIVSHSSMRALSDIPRNVSDEMLRALARNGGVMGINLGKGFINPRDAEALRSVTQTESEAPSLTGKALDDYAAEMRKNCSGCARGLAATLEDVADHVDHAVEITGIDHVGIGSDFDGISGTVNGLEGVSKMPGWSRCCWNEDMQKAT